MACQRIALALGGGGARGVAHLGVIEELLASGLVVERLVGVSIGSLAGAMYAFEPEIHLLQSRIIEYLQSPGFREFQGRMMTSQTGDGSSSESGRGWTWNRVKRFVKANLVCQQAVLHPSILPGDVLQHAVDHLLPDADIAEAPVPLSIVAVDLLAGERVILERGSVKTAVRASSSIPGVFPPVAWQGRLLCDIGTHSSLPTLATRQYSGGCLVAVDVSSELRPVSQCPSAVDVLVRMNNVSEHLFRSHVSEVADVVIRPDVGGIEWFDFSSPQRLIELGRSAVRQTVTQVKSACCEV